MFEGFSELIATLTTFNELDQTKCTNLLRSEYKDAFAEKHGMKLGLMSGFVKVTVSGLQNQPIIDSVIDRDDIVYRDYIDISIAVGTQKVYIWFELSGMLIG
ncbi:unnamed protein product [Musa acuminata subsp. malaccensis]|uniref:dihydrolipoyllysine-residue succinyltransferase n=1 Tax=Musa acuminata subsp. malaccensis TaxID=214687 RepID=A0A804KVB6_MUSAM|nr:unnamed protein product [Musa acuminata subsp. malaccensis]